MKLLIMIEKIAALDIETENTGADVRNDNKRIISIQIYNKDISEIYYHDSKEKGLKLGKERVKSLLSSGYSFVGYNVLNFDIPLLKEFLDLEIPLSNVIDISQMNKVVELKQNFKMYKLEAICAEIGVRCDHKKLLVPMIEKLKQDPKIVERAKIEGSKIASLKSWSLQFSQDRALDLICGGSAILQAYNEFVESNGNTNSIFHQYAMGDVISEYELYNKLKRNN